MPTLWSARADLTGPARLVPAPRTVARQLAAVIGLIAVLALGGCWLVSLPEPVDQPDTLESYVLEGPRSPACLRMVIGTDVSGSMSDYAAARDSALAQLQHWATLPQTLRADDEMTVVDFARTALTRFPPTPAASSPSRPAAPVEDGHDTLLLPMLEQTRGFSAATGCEVVLLLLSDAQIADLPATPAEGRKLMREFGIHDIQLLVPGEKIDVPDTWAQAYPDAPPIRFDGLDPDETALTIGRTVGALTGQNFEPITLRSDPGGPS